MVDIKTGWGSSEKGRGKKFGGGGGASKNKKNKRSTITEWSNRRTSEGVNCRGGRGYECLGGGYPVRRFPGRGWEVAIKKKENKISKRQNEKKAPTKGESIKTAPQDFKLV